MGKPFIRLLSLCLAVSLLSSACTPGPVEGPGPLPEQSSPTLTAVIPDPAVPTAEATSLPVTEPTPAGSELIEASTTPSPSPTVELSATLTNPANGPAPTFTRRPTRTPTITPTPAVPLDYLYIVRPGPRSKVTSPINLEAFVIPGANSTVRLELLGEDGRALVREVLRYSQMNVGMRFQINPSIDFEIPGVSEAARLQVSVADAKGRPIALTSVDLILLSIGEPELNPSGDLLTPFFIQQPRENQVIEGGTLSISGKIRPMNDQPVIFELITDQGQTAASKQVTIEQLPNGEYTLFQLEIPYTLANQTGARLIVRQPGGRIPGDAALASVAIYLKP